MLSIIELRIFDKQPTSALPKAEQFNKIELKYITF